MNKELELFSDHTEIQTMTVKEVAESLNVTERLVQKTIQKLPNNHSSLILKSKQGGYQLQQTDVTLIKMMIESNPHIENSTNLPKTDLEKKLLIKQGYDLLMEEVETLRSDVVRMEPKEIIHDQILDSDGLILPSVAGKMIMGHPNKFTAWLQDHNILFKTGRNKLLPYSRPQNKGYLVVKPVLNVRQNKSYDQTFFTPEGLIWITNKWNKFNG